MPAAAPSIDWPSLSDLQRMLSLRDYNTRVIVLGVTMLGLAAGAVGTFMLLRKRAMLSDAVSHATFPGVAGAFMVMVAFGGSGKSMLGLLSGATLTGLAGMLSVVAIRRWTRLKDDVALAIVLSVFFGLGAVLIKMAERMPGASAAGLNRFIEGSAASMLYNDALTMLVVAVVVVLLCALLFKEFALLCFDPGFAAAQGWPTTRIDMMLMTLAVAVTVVGLQAVGLILIIAMLIIPPAAARFWSDRLLTMTVIAAGIGMLSGYLGVIVSGLMPKLPAGPIIVLVATLLFALSLLLGVRRDLLVRVIDQLRLRRKVGMQHLLRAAYEAHEQSTRDGDSFDLNALLAQRAWSARRLRSLIRRAQRAGWMKPQHDGQWRLTDMGQTRARELVRNHRLWELYLITHADIAPSHVDRDADAIEHVLGEPLVRELEQLLRKHDGETVPASPHATGPEH